MVFETEPAGYEKTVLSDLQGAWQNLREAVVEQPGFSGCCGIGSCGGVCSNPVVDEALS